MWQVTLIFHPQKTICTVLSDFDNIYNVDHYVDVLSITIVQYMSIFFISENILWFLWLVH